MRRHTLMAATIFIASVATAAPGFADTVFDFETIAQGTYTSASQTVGALTATFTDAGGGSFEIEPPTSGSIPGLSGNALIDYGAEGFGTGSGPVNANFSSAVSDISITGGDYGDDVDNVTLAAYSGLNGTGTLLGYIEGPDCCSDGPASETVTLDVAGAQSVQFYTADTDAFPGSVFFDNLTVSVSAAPEPSTWALMIAGIGMIGAALRFGRRRGLLTIA